MLFICKLLCCSNSSDDERENDNHDQGATDEMPPKRKAEVIVPVNNSPAKKANAGTTSSRGTLISFISKSSSEVQGVAGAFALRHGCLRHKNEGSNLIGSRLLPADASLEFGGISAVDTTANFGVSCIFTATYPLHAYLSRPRPFLSTKHLHINPQAKHNPPTSLRQRASSITT